MRLKLKHKSKPKISFEQLMASRRYSMEVDLNQVDKPFNTSGKYKVFDKPIAQINDIFDDDEAIASVHR